MRVGSGECSAHLTHPRWSVPLWATGKSGRDEQVAAWGPAGRAERFGDDLDRYLRIS